MKPFFFMMITLAISSLALAYSPNHETTQITRALINNPSLVQKLKANNSTNLVDVEITETKPGVFQYTLVFNRQCECIPSTATLHILEDLTQTYADGPIKYTTSISIKTGF